MLISARIIQWLTLEGNSSKTLLVLATLYCSKKPQKTALTLIYEEKEEKPVKMQIHK